MYKYGHIVLLESSTGSKQATTSEASNSIYDNHMSLYEWSLLSDSIVMVFSPIVDAHQNKPDHKTQQVTNTSRASHTNTAKTFSRLIPMRTSQDTKL